MDAFFERRGAFCSARDKMRVPLAFGVLTVMALEVYDEPRTITLDVISE